MSTVLNIRITNSGINGLNQTYTFTCSPSVRLGGPVSRIYWLKNGQELNNTATDNSLTYTIVSLTTSDSGNYTCRVMVGSLIKIITKLLEVSVGK